MVTARYEPLTSYQPELVTSIPNGVTITQPEASRSLTPESAATGVHQTNAIGNNDMDQRFPTHLRTVPHLWPQNTLKKLPTPNVTGTNADVSVELSSDNNSHSKKNSSNTNHRLLSPNQKNTPADTANESTTKIQDNTPTMVQVGHPKRVMPVLFPGPETMPRFLLGMAPPGYSPPPRVKAPRKKQKPNPKPKPDTSSTKEGVECCKDPSKASTGRWTPREHAIFLDALCDHGKQWTKVAMRVKTRTVLQTRTHAQKYLMKLQKDLDNLVIKGVIGHKDIYPFFDKDIDKEKFKVKSLPVPECINFRSLLLLIQGYKKYKPGIFLKGSLESKNSALQNLQQTLRGQKPVVQNLQQTPQGQKPTMQNLQQTPQGQKPVVQHVQQTPQEQKPIQKLQPNLQGQNPVQNLLQSPQSNEHGNNVLPLPPMISINHTTEERRTQEIRSEQEERQDALTREREYTKREVARLQVNEIKQEIEKARVRASDEALKQLAKNMMDAKQKEMENQSMANMAGNQLLKELAKNKMDAEREKTMEDQSMMKNAGNQNSQDANQPDTIQMTNGTNVHNMPSGEMQLGGNVLPTASGAQYIVDYPTAAPPTTAPNMSQQIQIAHPNDGSPALAIPTTGPVAVSDNDGAAPLGTAAPQGAPVIGYVVLPPQPQYVILNQNGQLQPIQLVHANPQTQAAPQIYTTNAGTVGQLGQTLSGAQFGQTISGTQLHQVQVGQMNTSNLIGGGQLHQIGQMNAANVMGMGGSQVPVVTTTHQIPVTANPISVGVTTSQIPGGIQNTTTSHGIPGTAMSNSPYAVGITTNQVPGVVTSHNIQPQLVTSPGLQMQMQTQIDTSNQHQYQPQYTTVVSQTSVPWQTLSSDKQGGSGGNSVQHS